MSCKQWLLVEWIEEGNVFPIYGVVNSNSLVIEDAELHNGKIIFVRTNNSNHAKQAQIIRISDDKRLLKEHMALLERQDSQVKNMVFLCMRTIRDMKSESLLGSLNSNQSVNGAGSSNAAKIHESSDESEDVPKVSKKLQTNKTPIRTPAQYKFADTEETVDVSKHKRIGVISSTPLPSSTKELRKITFDQATQTDKVIQVSEEKFEQVETILNHLYTRFRGNADATVNKERKCIVDKGVNRKKVTSKKEKVKRVKNRLFGDETDTSKEKDVENLCDDESEYSEEETLCAVCSDTVKIKCGFVVEVAANRLIKNLLVLPAQLIDAPIPPRSPISLVDRLQINCDTDLNIESMNETAECDRPNQELPNEEPNTNTVNDEAEEDTKGKAKVQVRRVSAQTTNHIESSYMALRQEMVAIGSGNAVVPMRVMQDINWNSYTNATRQLLQAVFPRKVLATHSLTGKQSPAFVNKPAKKCLDPKLINDIVDTVAERCRVPRRSIRSCISVKCSDEAKLHRSRLLGKLNSMQPDQENIIPKPGKSRESNGNEKS